MLLSCPFSSYSHRTPNYFTSCRHPEALDQGRQKAAYRETHLAHREGGRESFLLQVGGRVDLLGAGMADHQDRASEVVRQTYQQERQAYQRMGALKAFRELLALPEVGYRRARLGHQRFREGAPARHRACLGTEEACRQGKAGRGERRRPGAGSQGREGLRRVGSAGA